MFIASLFIIEADTSEKVKVIPTLISTSEAPRYTSNLTDGFLSLIRLKRNYKIIKNTKSQIKHSPKSLVAAKYDDSLKTNEEQTDLENPRLRKHIIVGLPPLPWLYRNS